MPETILAAFSAVGSAGAATAGTAAVAGGIGGGIAGSAGVAATAGSFFSASTLGTILQGGLSLFSVVSGLNGADEAAGVEIAKADDAREEVDIEALQGLERRNSLRDEAHAIAGQQAVAFAASGVDLTFGAPVVARNENFRELDKALEIDQGTETSRITRLRERSRQRQKNARNIRRRGKVEAGAKVAKFGISVLNRG